MKRPSEVHYELLDIIKDSRENNLPDHVIAALETAAAYYGALAQNDLG